MSASALKVQHDIWVVDRDRIRLNSASKHKVVPGYMARDGVAALHDVPLSPSTDNTTSRRESRFSNVRLYTEPVLSSRVPVATMTLQL
jgi:hypothetical protein